MSDLYTTPCTKCGDPVTLHLDITTDQIHDTPELAMCAICGMGSFAETVTDYLTHPFTQKRIDKLIAKRLAEKFGPPKGK